MFHLLACFARAPLPMLHSSSPKKLISRPKTSPSNRPLRAIFFLLIPLHFFLLVVLCFPISTLQYWRSYDVKETMTLPRLVNTYVYSATATKRALASSAVRVIGNLLIDPLLIKSALQEEVAPIVIAEGENPSYVLNNRFISEKPPSSTIRHI